MPKFRVTIIHEIEWDYTVEAESEEAVWRMDALTITQKCPQVESYRDFEPYETADIRAVELADEDDLEEFKQ